VSQFLSLVRLFWQQLVRRKSLWIVVAIVGVVLLINGAIQSQLKGMLEQGVRYDIATRRAAAALEQYGEQIRQGALILAIIVGALVAPASRRDGTTQFLFTLSVSRSRLALAQYGALALFVAASTIVVHAGYMATAYYLGVMRAGDAALSWVVLLAALLVAAAMSFCLSLSRPALMVYGILLGVPYILIPLLQLFVGSWEASVSHTVRLLGARWVDNAALMFPDLGSLLSWPRLVIVAPERPPLPALGLEALHAVAAATFWILVGLWAYRRHDLGSRLPTK
jgi:ABC-type transport system involved in multi-copper enzyme maturation permease subunit